MNNKKRSYLFCALLLCMSLFISCVSKKTVEDPSPVTPITAKEPNGPANKTYPETVINTPSSEPAKNHNEGKDLLDNLSLERLVISNDVIIVDDSANTQYTPILIKRNYSADIDKLIDAFLAGAIEHPKKYGRKEYTKDDKVLAVTDGHSGRGDIYFTDRSHARSDTEPSELDEDVYFDRIIDTMEIILGIKYEGQYILHDHPDYSVRKSNSLGYTFMHVYQNGLVITEDRIDIEFVEDGVYSFNVSWYDYEPDSMPAEIMPLTDALLAVDNYSMVNATPDIPIIIYKVSLVYSHVTEYLRSKEDAEWDKYTLHWKIDVYVDRGDNKLYDSFYVNCLHGAIHFTSNSMSY